jgi:hypothetical protein
VFLMSSLSAAMALAPAGAPIACPRDVLWEHCRNNLGIARLLVREERPQPLVATACAMALETACRAALEQAGLAFDGDVDRSLARLGAPPELRLEEPPIRASERLASAERIVRWIADYLRREAPERAWGC